MRTGWAAALPLVMAVSAQVEAAAPVVPGTAARNAKAAFVYYSQATQNAALKPLDATLIEQRKRADALGAKLAETQASLGKLKLAASASRKEVAALEAQLAREAEEAAAAREAFTAQLAAKDADYASELAILRRAADDILSTPEGLKYLEANNAGDLAAADAIEEKLIAARQKMRDLQAAADRRAFARVALDNRDKGLRTTAAVITRWEEVARLDPGNHADWLTLARLQIDAGNMTAALESAKRAQATASSPLEQAQALMQVADALEEKGQIPQAVEFARSSLRIASEANRPTESPELLAVFGYANERLGSMLTDSGQAEPASGALRAAVAAQRRRLALVPGDRDARDSLSSALRQLAVHLRYTGQYDESQLAFSEADTLAAELVQEQPGIFRYRRGQVRVLGELARLQSQRAQFDQTIATSDRIVAILQPLADADPANAWVLSRTILAQDLKARALVRSNKSERAIPLLRDLVTESERLLQIDPSSSTSLIIMTSEIDQLGNALNNTGDHEGALQAWLRVQKIKLAAPAGSWTSENRYGFAISHYKVGTALLALGKVDGALAEFRAGLAIADELYRKSPEITKHADVRSDLMLSLAKAGAPEITWQEVADFLAGMLKRGTAEPGKDKDYAFARQKAEAEARSRK